MSTGILRPVLADVVKEGHSAEAEEGALPSHPVP
jgi:hypothetical protein